MPCRDRKYAAPKMVTIKLYKGESPWQRGVELFKSCLRGPHAGASDLPMWNGEDFTYVESQYGLDLPNDEYHVHAGTTYGMALRHRKWH